MSCVCWTSLLGTCVCAHVRSHTPGVGDSLATCVLYKALWGHDAQSRCLTSAAALYMPVKVSHFSPPSPNQATEEVSKNLVAMKEILYGTNEKEPQTEAVAQLAQELYNSGLLGTLVADLQLIDFEVRNQVLLLHKWYPSHSPLPCVLSFETSRVLSQVLSHALGPGLVT